MQLKNSKTLQNLVNSFAGECQARTRYKFLKYGAKTGGYTAMADLIEDVIKNEFQHARMMYSFIQTSDKDTIDNIDVCSGYPFREKWNLLDNLGFARDAEKQEATEIYPKYAQIARDEGFDDIAGLFDNIAQVEDCHHKLFSQLYDQLKDKTMYKKNVPTKFKCGDCGYEATSKEAWTQCPLCQAAQGAVLIEIKDGAK